ncbi:MAG: ATP-binding protein [Candidatus Korobacteraceae bacterium]
MFSRKPNTQEHSAAWRIAIWPTVAFAVGSAVAFAIMYLLIARDILQRSDAWLSGEAEVLADVAANTPQDALYDRLVAEVAELASREVSDAGEPSDQYPTSVFYLQTGPGQAPIWVGPTPKEHFIPAIQATRLVPGVPGDVQVPGWKKVFRVVYKDRGSAGGIYLGFADVNGARMLDRLTERCLLVWGITVALGFLITWLAAFRTLARVQRISDTVSHMGSEDLSSRLPEGPHPDEITRLSRTFNRMLERIQSSVHQMRVLTDSVAHDLKSPVTSIRGSLEVALSSRGEAEWRERVAEAIEGLDRLAGLLNTTLDVAEAEAGALQLRKEPVDLAELVRQLVDLYQPAMAERKHEVVTELQTVCIEADAALLHRTIANLLDNEIAHLPAGCRISIRVRASGGNAELVVADDGPGFPPGLRSRAFERFVKGQHSTGHGLGLAFVGAAIQAHGGSVEIGDRDGGGAMIVLTVPLAEVLTEKA